MDAAEEHWKRDGRLELWLFYGPHFGGISRFVRICLTPFDMTAGAGEGCMIVPSTHCLPEWKERKVLYNG
jgi:hypothetical protein